MKYSHNKFKNLANNCTQKSRFRLKGSRQRTFLPALGEHKLLVWFDLQQSHWRCKHDCTANVGHLAQCRAADKAADKAFIIQLSLHSGFGESSSPFCAFLPTATVLAAIGRNLWMTGWPR
mmetsp:Transcript_1842/g.2989  ORF Transcript_1842/g.2989 Transcript_1842/m.2989 type:complete len:120 (+) Transcript_1842:285-644(+)